MMTPFGVPVLPHLPETPSQTAGPYVHIGLIPRQAGFDIYAQDFGSVLAGPETAGEPITIEGRVFDGVGALVRDALIEIWQADAAGVYGGPFRGWGRAGTDFVTGLYSFRTIKPGPVPAYGGIAPMAPHATIWIVSRGINTALTTRLYFSDEAAANDADPVLALIDPRERRDTLIARRSDRADGIAYVFDIHLQGPQETVFFDV